MNFERQLNHAELVVAREEEVHKKAKGQLQGHLSYDDIQSLKAVVQVARRLHELLDLAGRIEPTEDEVG